MNKQISQLRKFFISECNKVHEQTSKRNRKLNFNHMFYFLTHIVTNNSSYSITNSQLKLECSVNVSKQAISKKKNNIDCELINSIRYNLLQHINKSNVLTKSKLYAVDGSKLSFVKNLTKDDYKLTKNKSYCKALLSCLYDVDNKYPVKACIDKHFDERKSFINNLLNEVPKNGIVMFDRGYYSSKLIKKLSNKQLYFIIRMKRNSLIVKEMIKRNINEYYSLDNFEMIRIVRYKVNNEDYYLCSNIFDKSINDLKIMYHKRWFVEEYFKTLKCNLKSNNFNCKNIKNNKQELYVQLILTILARYIEALSTHYYKKLDNKSYFINHKNTLNIVGNNIIYLLLFKKSNKKIIKCIIIINNERIYNKAERHFKRIRIRPPSKWYYIGIVFKKLLLDNS